MRYYIATKVENAREHSKVKKWLDVQGHKITYDWTLDGKIEDDLLKLNQISHYMIKGVLDADLVIMLWPGGRGTHVELGAALASNKRVIIETDVEEHHIASPSTCAFYHHSRVTLVKHREELFDILRRLYEPEDR